MSLRLLDEDPGAGDGEIDALCTVGDITSEDQTVIYALDCVEGGEDVPHEIEVRSNPTIELGLGSGAPVHLLVARNFPIDWGLYEFIALRDADDNLIAAKFAPYRSATPPAGIDPYAWYAPLTFASVDGLCDPVLYEEDPCAGGSFISHPCPVDITRLAVDFTTPSTTVRIYGDSIGEVGPFRIKPYAQYNEPATDDCEWGDSPWTSLVWVALRPG